MERPYVSIVVAVYNREKLLARCLDTLVYQTLENIEILVVDDFSTDNSLNIALEYQNIFPNKIKVFENTKKGVACAKNLGIEHATGEFITFVDSDDYVEYWAYEKMYERAKKLKCEILCAPFYRIKDNTKSIGGKIEKLTMLSILFSEITFLWAKLIKKEVFERFGNLPELSKGEDAAFIYIALSYLENRIGYFERPYYYYELSDNSICASSTIEIVNDVLKGNSIILANTNPEYLNIFKCIIVRRTLNLMSQNRAYADILIDYLKTHEELYSNNLYLSEKCPVIYKWLKRTLDTTNIVIPKIAYVNGFGVQPSESYLKELNEKLFRAGTEIIILNEDNCDVKENDIVHKAYKEKNFQFVGEYFILKYLYEQGGIYVSEKIQINHALDPLTNNTAFFTYVDDRNFSADIYGAAKENTIIKSLLETYFMPELYENPYEELSHRIKTILITKAGIHLSAREVKLPQYDVTVFEPSLLIQEMQGKWNFCQLKLSVSDADVELYNKSTLQCLIKNEINAEKSKDKFSYSQDKTVHELMREKEEILNSTSWKITKPLRKIGDFVYRINKRQYKK